MTTAVTKWEYQIFRWVRPDFRGFVDADLMELGEYRDHIGQKGWGIYHEKSGGSIDVYLTAKRKLND
jgi:hypothetical protein